MKRIVLFIVLALLLFNSFAFAKETKIEFFYGSTCPFCAKEREFLNGLKEENPEIEINYYDVAKNIELLKELYLEYNVPGESWGMIPIVFVGNKYFIGYSQEQNDEIRECLLGLVDEKETAECEKEDPNESPELPLLGKINISDYSFPLLSATLGFLDGFNICSLGALMLILALVLSLKSRKKILLFGGVFILTTSIIYGALVVIWYKIFSFLFPYLNILRYLIGSLGIIGGIYFLRQFLKFRKGGATCEIETGKSIMSKFSLKFKSSLEGKRNIFAVLGLLLLFAGIITIVEFPCSSVVPLFFAGVLADAELSTVSYLSYISIFVFFYMIDEIIVFMIAFFTMSLWLASGKFITKITLIQSIILFALGLYYLLGFGF